ncbi:MAG: four helix bundle protein [Anaerolineae bacterium]|nr:four helix bundle protein [Anaerolineae bacterium]MCB9130320.1 four helix bundle protein [Anaerolineales bacterium]
MDEQRRGQRGFEDLECYQLALKVLDEAYDVVNRLPREEEYNLKLQMRKASVSVTFNIPEGYGRYHYLDSLRFYYIARGSLMEVLGGFVACDRLKYTAGELDSQRELCHQALRSLNGYIRYVRNQQQGRTEYGARYVAEDPLVYHLFQDESQDDVANSSPMLGAADQSD